MNLLLSAKRQLGKLAYSLMSHAPAAWERKFAILMDVLSTDVGRLRKTDPMSSDFPTMPDLPKIFPGLDDDSLATLRRFVAKLHLLPAASYLYSAPRYALLWGGVCTQAEYDQALADEKRLEELRVQYHLQSAEVSSLIYHHGLRFLPEQIQAGLRDTVFIDGGAFQGDSTLAFLQYRPRVVWAFEPSPPSRKLFLDAMHANQIPDTAFRLFPQGLSDKNGTIRFDARAASGCALDGKGDSEAELVPLDSLTPPTRIGVLKADLEGMGMSMLRGAVETIRRDLPVLSLSFYHNADEFLNTYAFVRDLGLPYDYKVLLLCPPWDNHELTLLAWPRPST